MRLLSTIFAICLSLSAYSQIAGYTLIADYPLTSDAIDATGNYAAATLENAPFQNGGVYSNGIYNDGSNNGSIIRLPNITSLNPAGFIVEFEYQSDGPVDFNRPVLLIGTAWRWLGTFTNTVAMPELQLFGNDGVDTQDAGVVASTTGYSTLQIRYENGTAYLNADGNDIATMAFTPNHNSDFTIGCDHGGIGVAYKGHIRNIKVYNQDNVGVDDLDLFQSVRLYPNPTTSDLRVDVPSELETAIFQVYDIIGKEVLNSSFSSSGSLDFSSLSPGIYTISILDEKGNLRATRKIEKL